MQELKGGGLAAFTMARPLIGGSYTVTYFRNGEEACSMGDATAEIVHYYDMDGTLLHCEYHRIERDT